MALSSIVRCARLKSAGADGCLHLGQPINAALLSMGAIGSLASSCSAHCLAGEGADVVVRCDAIVIGSGAGGAPAAAALAEAGQRVVVLEKGTWTPAADLSLLVGIFASCTQITSQPCTLHPPLEMARTARSSLDGDGLVQDGLETS